MTLHARDRARRARAFPAEAAELPHLHPLTALLESLRGQSHRARARSRSSELLGDARLELGRSEGLASAADQLEAILREGR